MSGLNFVGLLMCLGGIVLHVTQKILIHKKETNDDFELQSNSLSNTCSKSEDGGGDTNLPLLSEKSTSLTNLLNANFSSDEEDDQKEENTSQILSDIVQRRE